MKEETHDCQAEVGLPKKKKKATEPKCSKCPKTASFFHSRCCNAHFEGNVLTDGTMFITCEKCGSYVARIMDE